MAVRLDTLIEYVVVCDRAPVPTEMLLVYVEGHRYS